MLMLCVILEYYGLPVSHMSSVNYEISKSVVVYQEDDIFSYIQVHIIMFGFL